MELISREQAIDEGMSYINGDCFCDKEDFAKYIEFIEQLPPIQPAEPKRGKWIYQIGMVKCDQCLRAIRRIDHDGFLNFCPNCGADMREVTT